MEAVNHKAATRKDAGSLTLDGHHIVDSLLEWPISGHYMKEMQTSVLLPPSVWIFLFLRSQTPF